MKRLISIVVLLFIVVTAFGCSKREYTVYEIIDVQKSTPDLITVYPDDPSSEKVYISDTSVISDIVAYYTARRYVKKNCNSPAPKSNMQLEFHYNDGTSVKVPIGDFTYYKLITTDDLETYINIFVEEGINK